MLHHLAQKAPLVTFLLSLFFVTADALAQVKPPVAPPVEEEIIEEEIIEEDIIEDDSDAEVDYGSLVQTLANKAYCSSKVIGQSPAKLVSFGYDVQAAHTLQPQRFGTDVKGEEYRINAAHGERLAINYPVYSKNSFLLNLGLNYAVTRYAFETPTDAESHALPRSLDDNGLRTLGFTATAFKPLNSRYFLIGQFGANLNGDYTLGDFQSLSYTRYTGAAIFGVKTSERRMWGLGLSRTYLGGALNYVPLYYLLYTAPTGRWGLEMLLPARFQYRRNVNPKNLLTAGWDIEGNTFRINGARDTYGLPYDELELRRSEVRLRLGWEHALTKTLWLSVQSWLPLQLLLRPRRR